MGNCIKTKLNESLSNSDGLKVLNGIDLETIVLNNTVDVNGIPTYFYIALDAVSAVDLQIIGDGYFTSNDNKVLENYSDNTGNLGKSFLNTTRTYTHRSNANYKIRIKDKSNLSSLAFMGCKLDPYDLLGTTALTLLSINSCIFTNDVPIATICRDNENLKELRAINIKKLNLEDITNNAPLLSVLRIHTNYNVQYECASNINFGGTPSAGVKGDIKNIGNLTHLTQFDFYCTGIGGDIFEAIELFRTNGRTSGSFTSQHLAYRCVNPLSFNGYTLPTNKMGNYTISWDSTHAAIVTSSIVYHIGYNASEIAALEAGDWSGKTLIDCN